MTASAAFDLVPFHDTQVLAARIGDDVRVPMKRFCATIGLPWEAQRKRLQRDEILAEGASMMEVPSDGGIQDQVTLPLELLPGFLFGAEAARYAPELRDRVRLFRRSCYAALHDHFFGKNRQRALESDQTARRRELPGLLDRLERTKNRESRRIIHELIVRACVAEGILPPSIDSIGTPAQLPSDLVGTFFAALGALDQIGVAWNHSRRGELLAVNLPHLSRLFADHRQPIRMTGDLRSALRVSSAPAFMGTKSINSVLTDGAVYCWTFSAWV